MPKEYDSKSLNSLKEHALKLGAADAQLIPVEKIVIEDRIVFKCRLGLREIRQNLGLPALCAVS